nr:MAG TPA: hypothetical protein [Caudoviricetes sp.]
MIIVEINSEYELKEQLEGTSYDDFSLFGLETIMDYLNECYTETPYEFEPCWFGSEFDEYSDAYGSTLDLDDLINDYDYLLNDEDEDEDEDMETWERVAQAIEDNGRNTVLRINSTAANGIVIVK